VLELSQACSLGEATDSEGIQAASQKLDGATKAETPARYWRMFEAADPEQGKETLSRSEFVAATTGTAQVALAAGTASAASQPPVQCSYDGLSYDGGRTQCINSTIHDRTGPEVTRETRVNDG
jgi:hypothetical protein